MKPLNFLFRPLLITAWLVVLAPGARASTPALTQGLSGQTFSASGSGTTVDLRNHFGLPGVTGQLVQFDTVLGKFNVEMLAGAAPISVENFLGYVNRGNYSNSIIHRSVPGFVIQGGGFYAVSNLASVPAQAPIVLEYNLPNERGTLSMARTNTLNSATSQWFISTVDNTTTLGQSNAGGYAVFGRVLGTGMSVVDAIAAVPVYTLGSEPFTQLPLRNPQATVANLVSIPAITAIATYPSGGGTSALTFSIDNSNPSAVSADLSRSNLTLTPGSGAGSATITITATDTNGNTASGSFTVNVTPAAPVIAQEPVGMATATGQPAAFTVVATGEGSLSYQWLKDDLPIDGATAATYSIPVTAPGDTGFYRVIISNDGGSTISGPASLTVLDPATIITPPQSRIVVLGNPVTFTVAATGSAPLYYQWSKDGSPIDGATAASYTIANTTLGDAGNYAVTVSNLVGVHTSSDVTLQVGVAPAITVGPQSQTVSVNATATFSVTAGGTGPLAYRWRKNGATINGATTDTLTLSPVSLAEAADYSVVITSLYGTATSSLATLTVNKLAQTIAFGALADRPYTASAVALAATASSGLPVTFAVVSGPASLSGSNLALTGVGTVTVRATQTGDASTYAAAPAVERSFAVLKVDTTVSLNNLAATYDGTPKSALALTNPLGLAVDLAYGGNATAPTDAGSYAVTATINDALHAGTATDILVIAQAAQTITFAGLGDVAFGTAPLALSATATSGLGVTFAVVSGPATLSGNTLTLTGAGAVTVRATQGGNTNYEAAAAVERSFTVIANFASWLAEKFTGDDLNNPLVSGPNADPDLDGFSNLLEYALGLEPKSASTAGLPEVATTATDWTYTYTRPAARAELVYRVEVSTNLATWTTANVTHELVATDANAGTQTWRASVPFASAANAFFRLQVER